MIDLTKPICTKDGREAKYLGKLPELSGFSPIGVDGQAWASRSMTECQQTLRSFPGELSTHAIDLSTLTAANFVRVDRD